jgi:hypothetical protein
MQTRTSWRTSDDENDGHYPSGEWSAWEAIEVHPPTRLEAITEPRRMLLASMLIVGLLALLYLHIASDVTLANNQLQSQRTEQTQLESRDQQLHLELGQATSPAYIARAAAEMGLSPSLPIPAPAILPASSARAGHWSPVGVRP